MAPQTVVLLTGVAGSAAGVSLPDAGWSFAATRGRGQQGRAERERTLLGWYLALRAAAVPLRWGYRCPTGHSTRLYYA